MRRQPSFSISHLGFHGTIGRRHEDEHREVFGYQRSPSENDVSLQRELASAGLSGAVEMRKVTGGIYSPADEEQELMMDGDTTRDVDVQGGIL